MNQLTCCQPDPLAPGATVATSLQLLGEDASDLMRSEKAASSQKAYGSDFRYFAAWCTAHGLACLPATPETVTLWVTWLVRYRKLSPATIARRVAAIRHVHLGKDFASPTDADVVKRAVRAARRELGSAPRHQKTAIVARQIGLMLDTCDDSLLGRRDRALIVLAFAAALRRSEVTALQVEDLSFNDKGMDVHIHRSKGDQEGQGVTLPVLHGAYLFPVAAARAWIAAAGLTTGPLFRQVKKGSKLGDALSAHAVAVLVKKRAKLVGIDPATVSGHSLRAGYVTSAVEHGAAPMLVAEQTRHKSLDMLLVYSRRADRYNNYSGRAFL